MCLECVWFVQMNLNNRGKQYTTRNTTVLIEPIAGALGHYNDDGSRRAEKYIHSLYIPSKKVAPGKICLLEGGKDDV